jgi:hypothetical protein
VKHLSWIYLQQEHEVLLKNVNQIYIIIAKPIFRPNLSSETLWQELMAYERYGEPFTGGGTIVNFLICMWQEFKNQKMMYYSIVTETVQNNTPLESIYRRFAPFLKLFEDGCTRTYWHDPPPQINAAGTIFFL